ncbi:MAG: DoxX family protein [Erythrobacter sp.]
MKIAKMVIYWLATAIVLLLLGYAAYFYFSAYSVAAAYFENLGYPTYIVYPLATLKIIAAVVIVTHRYNDLRDMAYAAYFINMIMALVAHQLAGDDITHAVVGAVCVVISYLLGNQVRGRPSRNLFGFATEQHK